MASHPLRPSRSLRRQNLSDPQAKTGLEIVRGGSIKLRPMNPRDSIDLAKQSHALRNAPLPPLPPMQRSVTSSLAIHQSSNVPQVPSKVPGDGRPAFLPPSPLPPRMLSHRRKQEATPDILVPEKDPQGNNRLSPKARAIGGRQSLGSNGQTTPATMPRASSLSDGLGKVDGPQAGSAKNGRWNLLGGLFAKRATASAPTSPPLRMVRHSSSSGEKSLPSDGRPMETKGAGGGGGLFRSRSKLKAARNWDELGKPAFRRARTAPIRSDDISKPLPALGVDANLRKGSVPLSRAMLDVEIPNVQLERYSVMFGNVLEHNNSPSMFAKDQTPAVSPKYEARGRQQPAHNPSPLNTNGAATRGRLSSVKPRNLSIDLGLSNFPTSPPTRPNHLSPNPFEKQNHRRSRTMADLKLVESPSITGQMGFIVQSSAKPSMSRSKTMGVNRANQKMSALPPLPPPPLSKPAPPSPPNRVASPHRAGEIVRKQSTARAATVEQQSLHQAVVSPPSSKAQHHQKVSITRQTSFSRHHHQPRLNRPEPPERSITAPPHSSSLPSNPPTLDLPPPPSTSFLPPSSSPQWNTNHAAAVPTPPPSSLSDLIHATLTTTMTTPSRSRSRSSSATTSSSSSSSGEEERYIHRGKAPGHFPVVVTHSPESPSARKSQQVLLECV